MSDPVKLISDAVDLLHDELLDFCQSLVRIPSLPGEEQKAQAFVASKLRELNLEVDTVRSIFDELKDHPAFCDDGIAFDERINVIGRWRGNGDDGRSLILNGHIDVVPVGKLE